MDNCKVWGVTRPIVERYRYLTETDEGQYRAKVDIDQYEWESIKMRINEYF